MYFHINVTSSTSVEGERQEWTNRKNLLVSICVYYNGFTKTFHAIRQTFFYWYSDFVTQFFTHLKL